MKKKLVGILMGVAMTATTIAAPTAIFADDIDIEDIAVETEEDDVADVEVEDEAEPAEEVAAEDDFSAEADDAEGFFTDAEDAGDAESEDVYTVVKYQLMSAPSVNSQKDGTVLRGEDNTIHVSFIPVINKNGVKVADLRKEDKIVCYAAAYIGNEQVTEPII